MIAITGIKFQIKPLHKLFAIGARQRMSSCDEGDLLPIAVGFLGMQLMHPGVPKRRSEQWDIYGTHVFDALVALGCNEQDIMDACSKLMEEAYLLAMQAAHVTEEGYQAAENLSGATKDSTPASLSPTDGPATL